MKKLSEATIRKYNGQQLANHLDRLGHEKYRVMNDEIWKLNGDHYTFCCGTIDKDAVLECIENVYYLESLKKNVPVTIWWNKEELSSTELPLDTLAVSLREYLECFFWGGEVVDWTSKWVYESEDFSLSFNFEGEEYEISLRNSIQRIPAPVLRSIETEFDLFKPIRFLGAK